MYRPWITSHWLSFFSGSIGQHVSVSHSGSDEAALFAAAQAAALALATGDTKALLMMLHPDFRWISETGEQLNQARFAVARSSGGIRWRHRLLMDPDVVIV